MKNLLIVETNINIEIHMINCAALVHCQCQSTVGKHMTLQECVAQGVLVSTVRVVHSTHRAGDGVRVQLLLRGAGHACSRREGALEPWLGPRHLGPRHLGSRHLGSRHLAPSHLAPKLTCGESR